MLKSLTDLKPILVILFNRILDTGTYPKLWAQGIVKPVFKKGDLSLPTNYRGITLISVIGKLFTRLLKSRLTTWGENNSLYFDGQAGFRSNHSTMDNIFIITSLIKKTLASKKKLYSFFIDLSKCFDVIVRENVFYKLAELGVGNKLLNVIKSLYSSVKCFVRSDSVDSTVSYMCFIGLLQGESLSPTLFAFTWGNI